MISFELWTWLYAFLVLGYFSQLYKDNIWFQLAEHSFIGIAAAHGMVIAYWNVRRTAFDPLLGGEISWIIPILFGVLILSRLFEEYRWISNWPLAIVLGVGTALSARGAIETQIFAQIKAGLELTWTTPAQYINNIILVVGTFCVIVYFLFTIKPVYKMELISRIGRLVMMAGFGMNHAWAWMSRIASVIAILQVLLWQWLGLGG
jgi:hypothetical protein